MNAPHESIPSTSLITQFFRLEPAAYAQYGFSDIYYREHVFWSRLYEFLFL